MTSFGGTSPPYQRTFTHVQHEICALVLYRASRCHDGPVDQEVCHVIPSNTTIYEFNPFKFGSWDPTTYGFVPLEYLGSNFSGGVLTGDEECVRGFDNVGFVMGTSSSLFNQVFLEVNSTFLPQPAKDLVNKILSPLTDDNNNDITEYQPNPFYGYHNSTSRVAQERSLTLFDGGEDLENIPFHPLIQPHRYVDVIFAIDSSADTQYHWPNGTSLVATYERSTLIQFDSSGNLGNGTSFPAVPDTDTMVNLGLNTHPTFFGCNSSNTTNITPLIVYIPNYPYVYPSNISTFDLSYNVSQSDGIVENGYNVATMGNGSANATWPTCVGCAIISRGLERTKTPVPEVCTLCFQHFCWDGSLDGTNASTPYEPPIQVGPTVKSGALRERYASPIVTAYLAVMILFMVS
ncbi:hypothetical protein JMJ35_001290 [Cladonia borealis]|uniref:Lysophospholipase n=1 Tax=Cladonia borealis TaxID=184061 RepID=A0AA39V5B0_9LECA|nr:hypothetical protein JMJ35_001290 [Cladonia borealis]